MDCPISCAPAGRGLNRGDTGQPVTKTAVLDIGQHDPIALNQPIAPNTNPCAQIPIGGPERQTTDRSTGPETLVLRGAQVGGAPRGPRDAEPVISPVSFRSPACRLIFSDDWLRHARPEEPLQRRPASATRVAENLARQQRSCLRDSSAAPRTLHRLQRQLNAPSDVHCVKSDDGGGWHAKKARASTHLHRCGCIGTR
jgi:hypothetical protein